MPDANLAKRVTSMIERHEGRERYPYEDTTGHITIGVGWNLSANGLPEVIIDDLLWRAYRTALRAAWKYPWFEGLSSARKAVILDMIYNLGPAGFSKFKRLHSSLDEGEFERAASEMLDSLWASQVGYRAEELAEMMRHDKWLHE